MQLVDESVATKITLTPSELPASEKVEFRPSSTRGVSFPENDRAPTIIVELVEPAEVQSITIPRDKTPDANVQQFEATFYAPNGQKINDRPIVTKVSPNNDKSQPAQLDTSQTPSNTLVSRIEITIVRTTDAESPKGVILDIKACTHPRTRK